jgi:hypothetical protein
MHDLTLVFFFRTLPLALLCVEVDDYFSEAMVGHHVDFDDVCLLFRMVSLSLSSSWLKQTTSKQILNY